MKRRNIDFDRREIAVRDAKGGHERVTMLPASLVTPLQEHLKRVKLLHDQDLAAGLGQVYLPCALDRKYPNASHEWSKRQYVFPSDRLSTDPRTGIKRRHTCTCAASAGVTWTKATCSVPSKLVLSETKERRAPGPPRQARQLPHLPA